ncbi:tRNA (adenosine(37)-N6)-dimethylallyltransferase MiaA [Caldicellulosiruptor acetigenus]|uniref:tRNA dimethylallyltransferase n=1 Tax=Caldicellulosiruptor acetigenus 6A TaxID=632516 RepID=G2PUD1_9FIRM|nr:tRNA (adenosine(37)-N6)-dimethylallyltransferase MiaA [Caldicellulosiruptor acetigenus]AEM73523.1 tRNA dimethylallyltransferase [Caldicellulosiruptor acetigenus 6A]
MEKIPLIVIAGLTATGKTDVAVELAQLVNGEVVSADSMCVYKLMDIGTAKPTKEQREAVRHHVIDVVFPDEDYNVAMFQKDATNAILDIYKRGKVPLLVGGTGFYIKSVVDDVEFPEMGDSKQVRKKLYDELNSKGNMYLYELLKEIDKDAANSVHPNNVKRVIRYLEIYFLTGRKPTEFLDKVRRKGSEKYNLLPLCFIMEREALWQRIDQRVEKMFDMGLVDEVKMLLSLGYSKDLKSMQGLGYKQVIPYVEGKISLQETKDELKLRTRQFAKRQRIWFKYQGEFMFLDVTGIRFKEVVKKCFELCKSVV